MAKTLIAFFSRADENYFRGAMRYVKVGNTETVCSIMKDLISADTFKIEMKDPYSPVYMTCIEEAKKDLRAKARPELVSMPESIEEYDTIVLAYPNYWGTMPMAVFSFLEAFDFTGKTILPLCTNEGSGMGGSERDIKKTCPGADVKKGLPITGSQAANSKTSVQKWLSSANHREPGGKFKDKRTEVAFGKRPAVNQTKDQKEIIMEYIVLNNGVKCPVIGIGTFMLSPAEAENSVREALKMGYSLVDTANAYVNECAVGRGMKDSGVKRGDIFLSTKLWPSEYENENAVEETLERLGVDYVDLLYIHQPAGSWLAGYRQLEKAYKEGKAKAIGISNFEGRYIEELETKWNVVPQFIQVEAHPYFTQKELRKTLDRYDIKLMSWYPLGHGDKSLIEEPVFAKLGQKYGKTPAQVILRWHTQMGFAVIPGSKNVDHIKDNLDILDFTFSEEEMAEIAKLDKGVRYYHRTDEQLVQFAGWRPAFEEK